MKAALLASGSKGNCCLVRHGKTSIIIDCGGTKRYLTQCFDRLQYDPACADALLVTHTHKDHVAQLNTFKHLPIYAWADLGVADQRVVEPFETFQIAEMQITVLPLSHDAAHTVGYVIEAGGEKLVYIKQRIINDSGHLNNEDSARVLSEVIGERTREIVQAHISQEGNTRAQAYGVLEAELSRRGLLRSDLKLFPAEQFGIHLIAGKNNAS